MKNLKLSTIIVLFLFFGFFVNHAQDYEQWVMDHWNKDKAEAFKTAIEQDKFVLLFVGRPTCPTCRLMSELFCNPESSVKTVIDDNFSILYCWYDDEDSRSEVYEYIQEYHEEREAGLVRQIPWLYIINPDNRECVASMYRPYPEWIPDEETMGKFLSVDLLAGNDLEWYADEDVVFEFAKEQEKFIFKFVGNGTSPNSQKVMKQLNEDPLKQILEKNYTLWYIDGSIDDCSCDPFSSFHEIGLTDEDYNTLPYISIINPDNPNIYLEELWGLQDEKTLEEALLKYTVSNEKIISQNKVTVLGNLIQISNRSNNEQIQIFTLTGQQITSMRKSDFTVRIDVSSFPKGALIVYSSTGWSSKIIIQ